MESGFLFLKGEIMNNTIKHQLNHRTIREFKNKEIPENIIEKFIIDEV